MSEGKRRTCSALINCHYILTNTQVRAFAKYICSEKDALKYQTIQIRRVISHANEINDSWHPSNQRYERKRNSFWCRWSDAVKAKLKMAMQKMKEIDWQRPFGRYSSYSRYLSSFIDLTFRKWRDWATASVDWWMVDVCELLKGRNRWKERFKRHSNSLKWNRMTRRLWKAIKKILNLYALINETNCLWCEMSIHDIDWHCPIPSLSIHAIFSASGHRLSFIMIERFRRFIFTTRFDIRPFH